MHRPTLVTDHIELSWLVTVRWTTLAACIAALAFGRTALGLDSAVVDVGVGVTLAVVSNGWLLSAARRPNTLPRYAPGVLVCLDVVLLAWCLLKSGGVLNPASIFFLVEIVLAALVLGRPWTWIVTVLSIAGYGLQLLAPTSELAAAASMHPQIAEHMRGMWLAFFVTAIIIGALVTRLAVSIERRDHAIAQMRDDAARQMRLMSLASMAAGAAHELSTPLSTIAVAAGELARSAAALPGGNVLASDIHLIRAELTRSRRILTDLSGRADESTAAEACPIGEVIAAALDARAPSDRARIVVTGSLSTIVAWPRALVARAGQRDRQCPAGIDGWRGHGDNSRGSCAHHDRCRRSRSGHECRDARACRRTVLYDARRGGGHWPRPVRRASHRRATRRAPAHYID